MQETPLARIRRWLKAAMRRARGALTRRRLGAGVGNGRHLRRVVAAATWEFPQPTHTFVQQDLLSLIAAGFDVWVFLGQRLPARAIGARMRRILRRTGVVETLRSQHLRDLDSLERGHGAELAAFLARVAAASGRDITDLRVDPLVLRACTFTRMAEIAGARYLHSWFCYDESFMAMFASQVLGIPRGLSCYVDHVLDDHPMKLVGMHLATADLVLATSARAQRELVGIGGAACAARVLVQPIGVDAAALRPLRRRRDGRGDGDFVLLSVSRIEPKKGLHVLLDACLLLRERGRRCRVQVLGGVDVRHAESVAYAQALDQRIAAAGLGDAFVRIGPVPNESLPRWFGEAAAFAAPYVVRPSGDQDGVPTAVLEAMAAGLPIVASRAGAIDEVVVDGQTGLLVEAADASALAAAIERLMDDPALGVRLAEAAAARFDREFAAEVTGRLLQQRVEAVLRGEVPR